MDEILCAVPALKPQRCNGRNLTRNSSAANPLLPLTNGGRTVSGEDATIILP